MIEINDFILQIDSKFWNHIQKETLIRQTQKKKRTDFLRELGQKIIDKRYHSQVPIDYIYFGKNHLVSRIVPVLNIIDYCVCYFCIKKIQDKLSESRQDGTFGGFSLGGPIRKKEDNEIDSISEIDISISISPYNKLAWINEWKDFQKKAKVLSDPSLPYCIKFDISNFYDSIDLDYLELKIRSICDKDLFEVIDLLFYFIRHWNRDFENYKTKNIGLPQDEVGDCSRILANFYLHEYDAFIKNEAEKIGCKYIRYSDDQMFYTHNEKEAKLLLFKASNYLSKINLNINQKKIDRFTSQKEFDYYWSFDIFDFFVKPLDKKNIEQGLKLYLKRVRSKKNFRRESILVKIIGVLFEAKQNKIKIKASFVNDFKKVILQEDNVLTYKHYNLLKVFNLLNNKEKKLFVKKLEKLSDEYLFNNFHLNLLKSKIPSLDRRRIRNNFERLKKVN